jgi:hypothetical protein
VSERLTKQEFDERVYPCPGCGNPLTMGYVDVTCSSDREPMVLQGRAACYTPGCQHNYLERRP